MDFGTCYCGNRQVGQGFVLKSKPPDIPKRPLRDRRKGESGVQWIMYILFEKLCFRRLLVAIGSIDNASLVAATLRLILLAKSQSFVGNCFGTGKRGAKCGRRDFEKVQINHGGTLYRLLRSQNTPCDCLKSTRCCKLRI